MSRFWLAPHYRLLLFCGPLVWGGLYLLGLPLRSQAINPNHFLVVVLAAPILEELVFRGWLQSELQSLLHQRSLMAGVSVANVLVSVLFTALHFLIHPPLWAVSVFIPSLVFGWVKDRYHTIWSCIGLHIVYNGGFFVLFG